MYYINKNPTHNAVGFFIGINKIFNDMACNN